jgi:hypothetical protein
LAKVKKTGDETALFVDPHDFEPGTLSESKLRSTYFLTVHAVNAKDLPNATAVVNLETGRIIPYRAGQKARRLNSSETVHLKND